MTSLDGSVAIVTGGAMGIGRAIAEAFVDAGADVVIADLDEEAGAEVADAIGARFERCDVSEYDEVASVVESTVDRFGHLDVVVNNAGIGSETSVEDMPLEEWERVMRVNLDGVMHGTKAAMPHLRETDGSIINMGSIYGLVGGKGAAAYSAAKGGVVNFTQQVAIDYATEGVRVNCICPGFIETPLTADLLEDERFYEYLKQQTPMNRPGKPEEVASMAVYLASDEASYITGANIPVDGGWTAF
ncbi:MAG: SDR family NAD(P)-dependent oxidoreductase [Halobacteriota archaeon]